MLSAVFPNGNRQPSLMIVAVRHFACVVSSSPYNPFHAALQHKWLMCHLQRRHSKSPNHLKETEMNNAAEQFIATNQANLQALEGFTTQAFAGVEKLVELNLAASKAAMGESFSHVQSILGAKDAQELIALQS